MGQSDTRTTHERQSILRPCRVGPQLGLVFSSKTETGLRHCSPVSQVQSTFRQYLTNSVPANREFCICSWANFVTFLDIQSNCRLKSAVQPIIVITLGVRTINLSGITPAHTPADPDQSWYTCMGQGAQPSGGVQRVGVSQR